MEEKVALNREERRRQLVLSKVREGKLVGWQAAEILGISVRQVGRLVKAYREGGVGALVHGNRGRTPANALTEDVKARVVQLAGSRYEGFNTQHFTEVLAEREGIQVSRSSVRRLLIRGGVNRPRKRHSPKHRSRRERYAQEGMLVQMDGSRHDWLEGRGHWLTLIGAIDDATGKVLHAIFREQEDAVGYFLLAQRVVTDFGVPLAVYHDGHAVFEHAENEPESLEEQLEGKRSLTQFGRLMDELGIRSIRSRSPQARGRIERLWGTFQDRLVSELRLARVTTINEANALLWKYLPRHNEKFAVPPARSGSAFRVPPKNVEHAFCFKHSRTVGLDNVVRFGPYRLQVLPDGRYNYARAKVEVREAFDGSLSVYYQGHCLNVEDAPAEAPRLRKPAQSAQTEASPRPYAKPTPDHPWRGVYRTHLDGGKPWG